MAVVDQEGGNQGDLELARLFWLFDPEDLEFVEADFGRIVDDERRFRFRLFLSDEWKKWALRFKQKVS